MMNKSMTAVLAAALMLGTASIAQASDNTGEYQGGFKVGPLGQRMGGRGLAFGFAGPRLHRYWDGRRSFAYEPGHHRLWRREY